MVRIKLDEKQFTMLMNSLIDGLADCPNMRRAFENIKYEIYSLKDCDQYEIIGWSKDEKPL